MCIVHLTDHYEALINHWEIRQLLVFLVLCNSAVPQLPWKNANTRYFSCQHAHPNTYTTQRCQPGTEIMLMVSNPWPSIFRITLYQLHWGRIWITYEMRQPLMGRQQNSCYTYNPEWSNYLHYWNLSSDHEGFSYLDHIPMAVYHPVICIKTRAVANCHLLGDNWSPENVSAKRLTSHDHVKVTFVRLCHVSVSRMAYKSGPDITQLMCDITIFVIDNTCNIDCIYI